MNIKNHYLAAVAIALASAGQLSAQSVPASLNSISPSQTVKGMFNGIDSRYVKSGVMQFDEFEAFCIDPYQGVVYNQQITYETTPSFSTPDKREAIAKLAAAYYDSGQTDTEAAAIQWAIWEVIIDGTTNPSLYSGDARVFSSSVASLGQQYLSNLDSLPEGEVIFLTNKRYQDVVVVVPEPSSSALLGLGIVGFLLRRKRA